MNMLKLHEEALTSTSTAYHEFLLRYKSNDAVVYGFVEGKEDPMFYRGLIEQALPQGWEVELIASGNRDNVLRSLDDFDWGRYSRKRICFFVDRDLTEFLGVSADPVDNLYITDGYSIENDAMAFGTYKRILEEIFNVTGLRPEDVEKLSQVYSDNFRVFQEALLPVMAQIILWQRAGLRPTLNDIDIRPFFEFSEGRAGFSQAFALASDRAAHAAACVGLQAAAESDRNIVEIEFKSKEGLHKFIRGKYVLWFLVESVTKAHQSIHALFPAFRSPPKARISLGQKNAMVVLAPRVRCPESLRLFISRGFVEYSTPAKASISGKPGWIEKCRAWFLGMMRALA